MNNEEFQEFVVRHLMNLSQDVNTLKVDVSGLKRDVSGLKRDVSGLKRDVSGLKRDVSGLKSDTSSLKNIVTRLEIRMENEVIDKLKVLFDGYEQHQDRIDRIERKLGINI